MSIKPLYPHYSFESVPSVYDEEALTALELCGRMGKKMNEVITAVNGWNVPQIVNVSPTGDKTGELDRVIIQGKLDAGYAVHLSAGEYYLNNPLIFRAGYMLRGDSQLNTVLNCKAGFIDHENTVSVDHVEVRDIRVKGPEGGLGIDISRKVQGLETGGRYAHFMNVYITGYDTAVRLGGCWCTNFTHCRIEAKEICVEQRGSCNHVKYDHCMFLGPVDEKSSIGVKITAEEGSENYGISFNHCEFERHNIAVQAYYCVALNVFALYVEGVNTVFSLDSCPAFLCDGGYVSYPERVCNTARSNTAKVFSKCSGAIKNLYIKVNTNDRWYMVSTGANAPLNIENINCVNDGEGECFTDSQQVNSIWNGFDMCINRELISEGVSPAATSNIFSWADHLWSNKRPNEEYKLQQITAYVSETFTATTSSVLQITIPSNEIGGSNSDPVVIFTGQVTAKTYNANTSIAFTPTEDYRKLIAKNISGMKMAPTVNFTNSGKLRVKMRMAIGEMVL